MTYEELLDKVYDLMIGSLAEAEAESAIEELLASADKGMADNVRDSLANLFATGPVDGVKSKTPD